MDTSGSPFARSSSWFDPYSVDPTLTAGELTRTLLSAPPVARSAALGGFSLLSRYDDVRSAALGLDMFRSGAGTLLPRNRLLVPPEEVDPPEHRFYRRIINPFFSASAVRGYEPWIREIARELLASLGLRARFDFVEEFARQLPRRVILRMLGLPDHDLEFIGPAMTALQEAHVDPEETDAAHRTIYHYLTERLGQQLSPATRNEFVSAVARLAADADGQPRGPLRVQHALMTVLLGGTETSAGAIGGTVHHLATHPADQARLRDEPRLIETAIDEFLRFVSPVVCMARTVACDTELHGARLGPGETVMLGFAPANRDPQMFDRADEVVLDRRPNPHLAFGAGPHRCPGAHLVRAEMKICLEELLARFRSFELEAGATLRYSRGQTRNLTFLPLVVSYS